MSDLNVLREELSLVRETYGRRSAEALQAFERLFRTSCEQGNPLDGLRRYSKNEVERFFAQTRAGTEGHVYWTGAKEFARNDGKRRVPRRWWWEHLNEQVLSPNNDLLMTCGEPTCIAPNHNVVGVRERRKHFTDDQMIGALQVFVMRNGYVPTSHDWRKLRCYPTRESYTHRFGSWSRAIGSAGLDQPIPKGTASRTREQAVESITEATRFLGHVPNSKEFIAAEVRAHLKSKGLPTSRTTLRKLLGPRWEDATRNAKLYTGQEKAKVSRSVEPGGVGASENGLHGEADHGSWSLAERLGQKTHRGSDGH